MKPAILLVAVLAGCTVEGRYTAGDKWIDCKGLGGRDSFSFHTSTIRNVRVGIGAPDSITITDSEGRTRTYNSEQAAAGWDCKERPSVSESGRNDA